MNENISLGNDIQQIQTEILCLRDQIAARGGNDFEIPTINALLFRFDNGGCSLKEALSVLAEVKKINQQKGDYH